METKKKNAYTLWQHTLEPRPIPSSSPAPSDTDELSQEIQQFQQRMTGVPRAHTDADEDARLDAGRKKILKWLGSEVEFEDEEPASGKLRIHGPRRD